jgi:hypothetical protein
VPDYADMPPFSVTNEEFARAGQDLDKHLCRGVSLADPAWEAYAEVKEPYYFERLVYVTNVEVLMVRFSYNYEVDLDRIHTERDLLAWALHFTEKTWIDTQRLHHFIEAVASIKHLSIYGL